MDRRRRKRMQRYWARAEAKACAAIDRLDPHSWFDLWHTHVDWNGRGRASAEDRHMVNAVAVRVLGYLEARLAQHDAAVQVWADLSPDTMDTAIYAHSANPNGSTFPVNFPAADWQQPPPAHMVAILPATHRAGAVSCDGSTRHIVQRWPQRVGKEVRA